MKLINLSEHEVVIYAPDEKTVIFRLPGCRKEVCARVEEKRHPAETVMADDTEIPVTYTEYGEVYNLPDEEKGVGYIVSGMVLAAVTTYRRDVFCPGPAVRDENKRIIGCVGLSGTILYTFG